MGGLNVVVIWNLLVLTAIGLMRYGIWWDIMIRIGTTFNTSVVWDTLIPVIRLIEISLTREIHLIIEWYPAELVTIHR